MRKYFQYLDLRNDLPFPSFIMLSKFDVTMFFEFNQDSFNTFCDHKKTITLPKHWIPLLLFDGNDYNKIDGT